jgi:hypothetical protein
MMVANKKKKKTELRLGYFITMVVVNLIDFLAKKIVWFFSPLSLEHQR